MKIENNNIILEEGDTFIIPNGANSSVRSTVGGKSQLIKDLGESWAVLFDYQYDCGEDDYYSSYIPVKIEKVNVKEITDYDMHSTYSRFVIDNGDYPYYKLFNTYEGAVRYLKATKEETEEEIKRLLKVFENYNKLMKDIE